MRNGLVGVVGFLIWCGTVPACTAQAAPDDRTLPVDSPAGVDSAGTASVGADSVGIDSLGAAQQDSPTWDSRFRLMVGGLLWAEDYNIVLPYFNGNARLSWSVPLADSAIRVGLGAEIGLHYVFPYAAIGPELRAGHLTVSGDIGGVNLEPYGVLNGFRDLRVQPVYGARIGYISRFTGIGLELQAGVISLSEERDGTLPYLAIAIAFR